jgi:hypothetical protein
MTTAEKDQGVEIAYQVGPRRIASRRFSAESSVSSPHTCIRVKRYEMGRSNGRPPLSSLSCHNSSPRLPRLRRCRRSQRSST